MPYKINIVIEEDQDGFYAYCPELEGCRKTKFIAEESNKDDS